MGGTQMLEAVEERIEHAELVCFAGIQGMSEYDL
jgi:hypothetical protein